MMMMGDRKKTVNQILGPDPSEAPAEDKGGSSLSAIAEDLISAVKDGDAEAVASALSAAYQECCSSSGE